MPRLPFARTRRERTGSALDGAPFLSLLEPDLRKRVRKRLALRRISAGRPLYRHGESADALYLIDSGRLRTLVTERPGHERVLQFLGPGEIVGEAAFIADTPHVTDAVAVDDLSVWRLARADFEALLGRHDGVLRYLAGVMAERQALANARLAAESQPDETRALRGFVTGVYSPRGGAGVTTISLNLAIALAERHPDDVVLLDLDVLFGHSTANLWLEPRGVLAQASPPTLGALDRGGLDMYLIAHASSLRIFPAARKPEEGQTITAEHVRAILGTLRRYFGHVVLDLPHTFNEIALTGLEAADCLLLVATPESAVLKDLLETRRIVTEVLGVAGSRLRYVLNHPQPYGSIGLADFAAATAAPWTEIGLGGDAPTAAALRGESLVDTRRNNAVVRGVVSLAEQIALAAHEHASLPARST
jgi:Flp pilus assembly CpaE family ATPase